MTVPSQAAHTERVKQPVPCLIYSCHPLIYKFHDAIKILSVLSCNMYSLPAQPSVVQVTLHPLALPQAPMLPVACGPSVV